MTYGRIQDLLDFAHKFVPRTTYGICDVCKEPVRKGEAFFVTHGDYFHRDCATDPQPGSKRDT